LCAKVHKKYDILTFLVEKSVKKGKTGRLEKNVGADDGYVEKNV
jgi:hypothetical protein